MSQSSFLLLTLIYFHTHYIYIYIYIYKLTDGLLACSYVPLLSSKCLQYSFALIQPILRSSYCQFGTQTLDTDVEDLNNLVKFLKETRGNDIQVSIIGHSTGCQIAVHFCKTSQFAKDCIEKIILQAPVSDREAMVMETSGEYVEKLISNANKCVENGESDQIVHMLYGIAPLTAQRTLDLYSKNGLDDMFSSDLTLSELNNRLDHMKSFQTLISISLEDQYVPKDVYPNLSMKLKNAMNANVLLEIPNANHSLNDGGDSSNNNNNNSATIFINEVTKFLF